MDKPKTTTDVANLAMALLGQPPLASIDSTTEAAKLARRVLPLVLREVEAEFRWAELVRVWAPSAPLDDLSEDDWYRFTLPTSCLRVLEVLDDWPYRVEGQILITPASAPEVRYITYSEDPSAWSATLVRAVQYALAIECAPTLTEGQKMKAALVAEYEQRIRPRARLTNSRHATGTTFRPRRHRWAAARDNRQIWD